jgi:hypothetical protein
MFLTFPNASTGQPVYSIWQGNVRTSSSPYGPWRDGGGTCGGNAAPVYRQGVFYCVSQHTLQMTSSTNLTLRHPFAPFSDINITLTNGSSVSYAAYLPNIEDPYFWIDQRDNWHIINHRYGARFQTGFCTRGCHWILPTHVRLNRKCV